MQLSFPIKDQTHYSSFQDVLTKNGIIQPSIIHKAHVLAYGFSNNIETLQLFIDQIRETYNFRRLTSNKLRQNAYLSAILWNEIRAIDESLRDERLRA